MRVIFARATFRPVETATQPAPPPDTRFLWDVARYEEAIARGVFTTEDPIELIDGEIITHMSPQKSPHAVVIDLVVAAVDRAFGSGYYSREQQPLTLGRRSMPEPDIAIVRGSPRDYFSGHPLTAELVIEVAESTLATDRGRKLRLYAREGIPEYWIVNLADDCVETYRRAEGEAYAEVRTFRRGESIPAVGPNAQPVAVADLLP